MVKAKMNIRNCGITSDWRSLPRMLIPQHPAGAQVFKPTGKLTLQEDVMKRLNGLLQVTKGKKGIRLVSLLKLCCVVCLCAITLALFPPALDAQDEDVGHNHSHSKPQATLKLTGQQLNTLVSQEATQNLVTLIALDLGTPVSGTWSGTVTSNSWDLTFVGYVNGQATQLTESGTLSGKKGNVASWTDSGAVGGTPVSGSGTATLTSNWWAWTQDVQGVNAIVTPQEMICYTDGPRSLECLLAEMLSDFQLTGPNTNYAVAPQLDLQTGFVFSSGYVESTGTTSIQEGSIDYSTGSISYAAYSLSAQGALKIAASRQSHR
jgi:hypothetical protein